jgi:hypothetical protein
MPRFLRYEDALPWVKGQARLTPEGLVRSLDATPTAAASFLRRMEAEGLIGPAGADGAHVVLGERRRRWTEPAPAAADPLAELTRLRAELESATRRATLAEGRLAAQAAQVAPRDRIALLRRMLARELHPDTAAPVGEPVLQAACAEVFKRVWPRIERVLDGAEEE